MSWPGAIDYGAAQRETRFRCGCGCPRCTATNWRRAFVRPWGAPKPERCANGRGGGVGVVAREPCWQAGRRIETPPPTAWRRLLDQLDHLDELDELGHLDQLDELDQLDLATSLVEAESLIAAGRHECESCGATVLLRKSGRLRVHWRADARSWQCPRSGALPSDPVAPWQPHFEPV